MKTESFEDFYALLGVPQAASPDGIRRAFRARMREWHPDVNSSPDATAITQRLIVAYKILNDIEARSHYDAAYAKRHRRDSETTGSKRPRSEFQQATPEPSGYEAPEFTRRSPERTPTKSGFDDPDLDRWVRTARREAAAEWKSFCEDFKDASKAAGAGAAKGLWMALIYAVVATILFSIIAALN